MKQFYGSIMTESELDNILINQKNCIIELINNYEFKEAIATIYTLTPLWTKCNYLYKAKELIERIEKMQDA